MSLRRARASIYTPRPQCTSLPLHRETSIWRIEIFRRRPERCKRIDIGRGSLVLRRVFFGGHEAVLNIRERRPRRWDACRAVHYQKACVAMNTGVDRIILVVLLQNGWPPQYWRPQLLRSPVSICGGYRPPSPGRGGIFAPDGPLQLVNEGDQTLRHDTFESSPSPCMTPPPSLDTVP